MGVSILDGGGVAGSTSQRRCHLEICTDGGNKPCRNLGKEHSGRGNWAWVEEL